MTHDGPATAVAGCDNNADEMHILIVSLDSETLIA